MEVSFTCHIPIWEVLRRIMRSKEVASDFLPTSERVPVWLFSATLFLSASLLFWVQLMVAKIVLPILGGTPAVWNTCMVFFQALLLAGYGYAHWSTKWLGVRRQAAIHGLLLLAPFFFLPIQRTSHWIPSNAAHPIPWLLGLLLRVVGLPFFVASTTAPLLQKWFAHTRHATSTDPYFLYAASNLGSLFALLSYPLVIEPWLRLANQGRLWTIGYALFALLTLACAWLLWRRSIDAVPGSSADSGKPPIARSPFEGLSAVTCTRRLRWALLSFAPSSLMLGVTTYLSTDIAPIPLFWVIPLGLYLLTFVLVFARRRLVPHAWMVRALPIIILPLAIMTITRESRPLWWLIPLHLLTCFVAAMICHGELAKDRPPAPHLTEFYLWMSVGGVLGGLFNALMAPLMFDAIFEYPLAMFVVCLLRPAPGADDHELRSHWLDYVLPVALGALVASFSLALNVLPSPPSEFVKRAVIYGPAALLCYASRYRPVRFGLGIGAFLFAGLLSTSTWERTLHMERSFFGAYRILFTLGPDAPYRTTDSNTAPRSTACRVCILCDAASR